VGTHDRALYVVMELLEGESLRDRLRAGPQPASVGKRLGRRNLFPLHHVVPAVSVMSSLKGDGP